MKKKHFIRFPAEDVRSFVGARGEGSVLPSIRNHSLGTEWDRLDGIGCVLSFEGLPKSPMKVLGWPQKALKPPLPHAVTSHVLFPMGFGELPPSSLWGNSGALGNLPHPKQRDLGNDERGNGDDGG